MTRPEDDDLVDYELEVLRGMAGKGQVPPWGAALSVALEALEGRGLVQLGVDHTYRITVAGHEELERREGNPPHGPQVSGARDTAEGRRDSRVR